MQLLYVIMWLESRGRLVRTDHPEKFCCSVQNIGITDAQILQVFKKIFATQLHLVS